MPVLDDLLSRRVLFVTGKGGTGKSSVAAALAVSANSTGRRVLLVDVDAKSDAARFLDDEPSVYRAKQALPGLWHLAMNPQLALDEYLRLSLKLPRMYRLGPLHKVFDFIATAAPGAREVLITGKIGFEERAVEDGRPRWDLIVVDAAASGQVLSHLRGPRTLQELVGAGIIRNQTDWVRELIEDPIRTGMVVVALAEEMPVAETRELVEEAPRQVATPVLAVVANRVVPPPSHPAALAALRASAPAVERAGGGTLDAALDAAALYESLSESQQPHLSALRALGLPVIEVPLLPVARHTISTTRLVAGALEAA
ncbi:MAG TPA: ArsA-related P-loop ATPase [Actinomycetota bacterium]|nr:ArsA-related P-loop ATPase [Actinomycetota bacterium]